MEDTIVFIACANEYDLIPREYKNCPVIITGVGPLNAISFALKVKPTTKIVNFGYVGSRKIEVGTTVRVGTVKLKHKLDFQSPEFYISDTKCTCYSSSDFEEFPNPNEDEFSIYDMELAFIVAVHPNTISFKTVSDKINIKQYARFVKSHS